MLRRFHRAILGSFLFALVVIAGVFYALAPRKAPPLTFTFLNGQVTDFTQLIGRPIVVTFWATDCASCLKEIPVLTKLYNTYHQRGLEIIGVSMYYDPPNHVVEFNKQYLLPYPLTLDIDGNIASAFAQTRVTPTTFLINPQGNIIWKHTGLFEFTQIQPKIDAFLSPTS
ncbi:MAG TPA: thioredoxin [Methylococcaceae bacterium]|nr:thioredoxin [Methylococcaceae bacterium]